MGMVFENVIPAVFMTIGDMFFMELVATDMVLNFCGRLNIFNGFMERDEDLFVLVNMMGLEYLTGRAGLGGDSVEKEMHRPMVSSRAAYRARQGLTPERTQTISRTSSTRHVHVVPSPMTTQPTKLTN